MTYPELFPTGVNGMKDAMREVKIGTSDYIKSRLLNKDPKVPTEHELSVSLFSNTGSL